MDTITVMRYWIVNPGRRPIRGYNYVTKCQCCDNSMLCQYGPGLDNLRAMLHRTHPRAKIVEMW